MQGFFDAHNSLIDNLKNPIRRDLMDTIDWKHRLIGIKGTRSIGKTTFILDYAKKNHENSKSCLYVNLNNFYFTKHSIVEFADNFRKIGGTTLLLDQVYKYPNWSKELKECYLKFPDLRIIFTGSPVMSTGDENPDLKDKAVSYHLSGLSFREFLNHQTGLNFASYSLEDILKYHNSIAKDILFKVKPLAYFSDYLHFGYYPFYKENQYFIEKLLKTMNLILEIDIPKLQQVELKYLPNLKKLFYTIASNAPCTPNVSKLSTEIDTSRATVMNYINYMQKAHLFNLLFNGNGDITKKPTRVLLQNTNLLYTIYPFEITNTNLQETFFVNQITYKNKLQAYKKDATYLVNEEYKFIVSEKKPSTIKDGLFYATDMLESGDNNIIPLWLFGFLY